MLAELNSNNWPLGVKVSIAVTVVFLTASCVVLKILFCIWLRNQEKKAYDDSEVSLKVTTSTLHDMA